MTGLDYKLGECRFACKLCERCESTDKICRARNRERAGFLALDAQ